MKKVCIALDESGNFGVDGRYFVIAGIVSNGVGKPLERVISRAVLKTKQEFDKYKNCHEIKASESYGCVKDYFLRKINSKDIRIRYIVCDLHHTQDSLIKNENVLYNFLLQFLILPEVNQEVTHLEIRIDKRTIKVKSSNSFEDYIKTKIWGELGIDLKVKVGYIESQNCHQVQAADFVANAVYAKYEYNHNYFYDIFSEKCVQKENFPRAKFGL